MAARISALIVTVIVVATVIAGLIVGAQRDDSNGPVDLIILNAKVYSGEPSGAAAEAVAVRGNQILRVGTNRAIKRLQRSQTTVIDAHGASVLPAFNDSSVELMKGAKALGEVDLTGADTPEDAFERIRVFAETHPRDWIVARGWSVRDAPPDFTRVDLDALVPDRPAYILSNDGSTAWANSRALVLAGIDKATPSPKGGTIVKDPRTREPNGVLKDAAVERIAGLPRLTDQDRLRQLQDAVGEAHRHGITSVHAIDGAPGDLELVEAVHQSGNLPMRIYWLLGAGPGFSEEDAEAADAIRKRFPDDPVLKTGAVRVIVGAETPPDANHPDPMAVASFEELLRIVGLLDRRGWQIAVTARDLAAARMALDAFERVSEEHGQPSTERRHRIDVEQPLEATDVERAEELGLVMTVRAQERQVPPDSVDATPAVPPQVSVWESLSSGGARLALGSGWPSGPLDPHVALETIVASPSAAARDADDSRDALTAALAAYTTGAAYASFDEHRKGVLARGMLADIVILSGDLFTLLPDRLDEATVTTTIFGERSSLPPRRRRRPSRSTFLLPAFVLSTRRFTCRGAELAEKETRISLTGGPAAPRCFPGVRLLHMSTYRREGARGRLQNGP